MNREELVAEFKKEYEKLCEKYQMEIAMFDLWDDDTQYSLEIFDRIEGVFYLE